VVSDALVRLRILTLNVRGLVDNDKRGKVFQLLHDHDVDIACLQETHAGDNEASWWSKQWDGPSLWTTSCNPTPDGPNRSAGTALLFSRRFKSADVALTRKDDTDGRYVHATLQASTELKLHLVGLYAPNPPGARRAFFRSQQQLVATDVGDEGAVTDLYHAVLGDFNCVSNPQLDRVAGAADQPDIVNGIVQLMGLTTALDTVDVWRTLHPNQRETTWRNATQGSRLDRVYLDQRLMPFASSRTIRCTLSDHDAVLCTVDVAKIERGDGYWMLNCSSLSHPGLQDNIRALCKEVTERLDLNASDRWELLKFQVRQAAMEHAKRVGKARTAELDAATKAYTDALDQWTLQPTEANGVVVTATRLHLEHLEATRFAAAKIRSRQRWHIKGERPTRYFCQLEKERALDKTIAKLDHPTTGAKCTSPRDMGEAAAAFYGDLFSPDAPDNLDAINTLLNRVPGTTRLDAVQTALCDSPISLDDLKTALDSTASGKTPGIDGLPKEFYSAFWDVVGAPLLDMVNHSLATGTLPASLRQGVVCLVYKKKGSRTNLANYRPLTMLTADYKLISKALSSRLDTVIDSLVHPDQTGFIRKRYILENVMLVRSTRRHLAATDTPGAIVFLDQEKAFDRVNWTFRDHVLERMGFGPAFRAHIQLLHNDVFGQVLINGFLSPRFAVLRGTRQGDPLSPGLFALVDEPFACSIRADPLYKGVPLPEAYGRNLKLAQYADDKAMALADNDDAVRLNHHLQLYEDASGARVNVGKSSALLLGPAMEADFAALQVPVLQAGQSTKYLGFSVGPDVTDRDLWIECAAKMTSTLAQWARRSLSIAGRITVIRVLATSKLWYLASIVGPPRDILRQMDLSVRRFLWKGKKAGPIRRGLCLAPRSAGGIGMLDIDSCIGGLQFSWLQRLLDDGDGKWKDLALEELRSAQQSTKWGLGTRLLVSEVIKVELPSPWSRVFRVAKLLHLHESAPSTFEQVLRQHLFVNSCVVKDNGDFLRTKAMRNAASNHISHVRNLLDDDYNVCAREQLGLSKITYDRIVGALPVAWQQLLHDGVAPPSTGEWFLADVIMPPQHVYLVHANDAVDVTLHRFAANTDGTFAALQPTVVVIALQDFDFARAHVTEHRVGHLCHGPQQLMELDPALLLVDQHVGGITKSLQLKAATVNGTTKALTALKAETADFAAKWPDLQLPWKRTLRWIWSPLRDGLVNDLLLLLVHRRLPLGDRRHWDPELNVSCPCGLELETPEHLFCECAVAQSVWQWFFSAWRSSTGTQLAATVRNTLFGSVPVSHVRSKSKTYWGLLSVVQSQIIYSIWLARNRWVFDEEPFSATTVKASATVRILHACQAVVQLHDCAGFVDTFDSLYATLQDTIMV
jgi:exonuclease III